MSRKKRSSEVGNMKLLKLGSGSYGQVYKGRFNHIRASDSTSEEVAIEFFCSRRHLNMEYEIMKRIQKAHFGWERNMAQAGHNVSRPKRMFPKLLHRIERKPIFCLVYQFIPGKCLGHFFKRSSTQRNPLLYLEVFKDLSSVISHVHEVCQFRHRDIKGDNVLVELDTTTGNVQVNYHSTFLF